MKIITQYMCEKCLSIYSRSDLAFQCESSPLSLLKKDDIIDIETENTIYNGLKVTEVKCSSTKIPKHDWVYFIEDTFSTGINIDKIWQSELGKEIIIISIQGAEENKEKDLYADEAFNMFNQHSGAKTYPEIAEA